MRRAIPMFAASLISLAACGPEAIDVAAEAAVRDSGETATESFAARKCAAPLTQCGNSCVDTSSDHQNCGTCRNHCPGGDFNWCVAGKCRFGSEPVPCGQYPNCPQTNCCYRCGGPGCRVVCQATPCD